MHPGRRGHVLSVNFIEFKPGHEYKLDIPVQFYGIEDCKGTKEGGIFLFGEENISCTWTGDHNIPRDIQVDLVNLERGQSVRLDELGELPEGLALNGRIAKSNPVLCHIGKTGGETGNHTPPWELVEDNEWKLKMQVCRI